MPAPKGNKFNLKKPSQRLSALVKVFCKESEKIAWKKKAGKKKLATWARQKLNDD